MASAWHTPPVRNFAWSRSSRSRRRGIPGSGNKPTLAFGRALAEEDSTRGSMVHLCLRLRSRH